MNQSNLNFMVSRDPARVAARENGVGQAHRRNPSGAAIVGEAAAVVHAEAAVGSRRRKRMPQAALDFGAIRSYQSAPFFYA
jgi:hypothetical protein